MRRQKIRYQPLSRRRIQRKSQYKFLLTILIAGFLIYALFTFILPNLIGGLSFLNRFKGTPKAPTIASEEVIAPPVLNIPFEATNTATLTIKGYAIPKHQVEIYLDNDLITTVNTLDDGSFISEEIPLEIGTNNIFGKTVDEGGNKSLPSKTIQLLYDNEKPTLEVKEPIDNQIISGEKKITVVGKTNDNGSISITINGIKVIVRPDGSFSQTIDLNDGDNNIIVLATSVAGNTTQITRKVTVQ